MNKPTVTSPWYAVFQLTVIGIINNCVYYTTMNDTKIWTSDIQNAYIFTNLKSAVRIAEQENAMIRLIFNEGELGHDEIRKEDQKSN